MSRLARFTRLTLASTCLVIAASCTSILGIESMSRAPCRAFDYGEPGCAACVEQRCCDLAAR